MKKNIVLTVIATAAMALRPKDESISTMASSRAKRSEMRAGRCVQHVV